MPIFRCHWCQTKSEHPSDRILVTCPKCGIKFETIDWRNYMIRNASDAVFFRHDCDRCILLGSWVDPAKAGENFDLYWCMQSGGVPTLIARYGDDGPDYISGICFKDTNRAIAEAYRRAVAQGLNIEPLATSERKSQAAKSPLADNSSFRYGTFYNWVTPYQEWFLASRFMNPVPWYLACEVESFTYEARATQRHKGD